MEFARAHLADCVGAPAASQASFAGAPRDIVVTLPWRGPLDQSTMLPAAEGLHVVDACVPRARSYPAETVAYEYVMVMVMGV